MLKRCATDLHFIDNGSLLITGSPRELKQQFGKKKLKVTFRQDNSLIEKEYDLKGIASDSSFLEMLKSGNLETIHTCEATMDDIFIEVTGHSLTSSFSDSTLNV